MSHWSFRRRVGVALLGTLTALVALASCQSTPSASDDPGGAAAPAPDPAKDARMA